MVLDMEISGEQVKVSKQFAADFEDVARHYRLRELGEYDEAKEAARRDIEAAKMCFAAMAHEIAREGDN
jgi:hypothetical protein